MKIGIATRNCIKKKINSIVSTEYAKQKNLDEGRKDELNKLSVTTRGLEQQARRFEGLLKKSCITIVKN
jgi:hypothetical protein